ncbi:hypothetical protein B2J93_9354 [Marssonina coronariae]|uniref:Uncharacterized protein n=1 Tax=Diplocarpon coronariae TaxID=2795749 RepID=A0A218ZAU0_9HELO|nr:hypothetical protein B2J93_9354 [Marssonina coronariae]
MDADLADCEDLPVLLNVLDDELDLPVLTERLDRELDSWLLVEDLDGELDLPVPTERLDDELGFSLLVEDLDGELDLPVPTERLDDELGFSLLVEDLDGELDLPLLVEELKGKLVEAVAQAPCLETKQEQREEIRVVVVPQELNTGAGIPVVPQLVPMPHVCVAMRLVCGGEKQAELDGVGLVVLMLVLIEDFGEELVDLVDDLAVVEVFEGIAVEEDLVEDLDEDLDEDLVVLVCLTVGAGYAQEQTDEI